jgi:hypothetical protein
MEDKKEVFIFKINKMEVKEWWLLEHGLKK